MRIVQRCSDSETAKTDAQQATMKKQCRIAAVSVGISEALVETALGLVVAIPAVWIYNYLTSRIEYFNVEMDNSSSELVDYFIKKTA